MSKPREFDLYFCLDDDKTISPYDSSVCENYEKWTPGCGWAEPTIHVIEYSAYEELKRKIEELEEQIYNLKCEMSDWEIDKT